MQVSKKKINSSIQKQIDEIFYQLLVDAQSIDEVKTLLHDLLTETERQVLTKRLAIAIFLDKGRSYEHIKNMLKVSSATIASVNEKMGDPGIQLALRKVKADKWADEWSDKITGLVNRLIPSGK